MSGSGLPFSAAIPISFTGKTAIADTMTACAIRNTGESCKG